MMKKLAPFALMVAGLVLGFTPQWAASSGTYSSGLINCGSPFIVEKDDLNGFGIGSCEAEGLSERRAWAFALVGAGLVLGLGLLTPVPGAFNNAPVGNYAREEREKESVGV